MNRIAGVIAMHARDEESWFFVPWGIVGSSFAINLLIALFLGGKTALYTGGLASIYIYMLVAGVITLKESFPFALGFSVRRSDYFLGTAALAAAVSAAWAILLLLLSLVESQVIRNWGVNLHFFHLPYFSDASLLGQFWTYFVGMLLMYCLGMVTASVHQRFSRMGVYIFAGVSLGLASIFSIVATYWNWWGAIFNWLAQQSAVTLALWLAPVVVLCAFASYALLRRATV